MYILEPDTACSAFYQVVIAGIRKDPGGAEGKLLSTGYLQALEVGAEITGKLGKKEKKWDLWWREAVDRVEQKPAGLKALLVLLLAEMFVSYYQNICLLF